MFKQEQIILWLTFNPRLALTAFEQHGSGQSNTSAESQRDPPIRVRVSIT